MKKIASPTELQAELRRLLAYAQGPERPSRVRLAAELNSLADRVARFRWTKTIVGDKIRIRIADHPQNTVLIEELPTKPLKRRLRQREFDTAWWVQGARDLSGSNFLSDNILRDAKLSGSMTYDAAVSAMERALEMAKQKTTAESPTYNEDWFQRTGWPPGRKDTEVSYLEVEPIDYEPVSFRGRDFSGTAEWTEFTFSEDKQDEYMRQMEGMTTFYKSKSPGGSRKLFKLFKANPDAAAGMTIRDFTSWLDKNKIAYSYVPTVWR